MQKILIINHAGYIGGGGVSLLHILKAFDDLSEKYEIEVYCPDNPPSMCDLLEENNYSVIRGNSAPAIFAHYSGNDKFILGRSNLLNMKSLLFKEGLADIKNAISASNPDIIALNSMTLSWLGPHIKKMGRKSICFHKETYASGLFGLRTKIMKSLLTNSFHGVAFISKNDCNETGIVKGISRIITEKVDPVKYVSTKNPEVMEGSNEYNFNVPTRMIYVGGPTKLKGAHVALKALNYLKDENVNLTILKFDIEPRRKTIVDCKTLKHKIRYLLALDYEAKLTKIIDDNNLWDKLNLIPTVKNPEAYILSSDIILFPSTSPHQARPLYEGGLARIPVIITEFRQTKEHARDRINCLTFKKNDYVDLSKKIKNLIEDQKLTAQLVNENYKQTISDHNLTTLADELDEFISSL